MENSDKKEILFYYESRQNPNGDPGFENQPRLLPDGTILVTDVRVKRTIRDYAKNALGEPLFVDFDKEGNAVTADEKAKELIGELKKDASLKLLKKTFDAPLFGALVTVRDEKKGNSFKITGPVQFGIGRSVNQVKLMTPQISGRFVGRKGEGEKQFSTFGKFSSVEYALIKIHGAVNPANLEGYLEDKDVKKRFDEAEGKLFECLWKGTNGLITRSKFPQRSVFYLDVTYDGAIYNDLSLLVSENNGLNGKATSLGGEPFDFTRFTKVMKSRKDQVKEVRVCACEDVLEDAQRLVSELKKLGIKAEEIRC